jgi:hypothetical protein
MNIPMLAISNFNAASPLFVLFIMAIVVVAIWDGVWKLIALWKSARHEQLAWFICLAIFNTAGILPILYILFFQKTAVSDAVKS